MTVDNLAKSTNHSERSPKAFSPVPGALSDPLRSMPGQSRRSSGASEPFDFLERGSLRWVYRMRHFVGLRRIDDAWHIWLVLGGGGVGLLARTGA